MFTLSKIFSPKIFLWLHHSINGKFSRSMDHFIHTSPKVSQESLVSLETLGSPLEFKDRFGLFEQCLAAQDEFEMTDQLAGCCLP